MTGMLRGSDVFETTEVLAGHSAEGRCWHKHSPCLVLLSLIVPASSLILLPALTHNHMMRGSSPRVVRTEKCTRARLRTNMVAELCGVAGNMAGVDEPAEADDAGEPCEAEEDVNNVGKDAEAVEKTDENEDRDGPEEGGAGGGLPVGGVAEDEGVEEDTKPVRESDTTFVCTHWHCWFCVSSALVVRSAILRFFSHGVFSVKFLCAPVSVCLKGP